jgi:hypothetical protein
MRIKDGFILREVAGTFVIISAGDDSLDFKGVITVNEVGALIWKGVEAGKSKEEIVDKILSEYDVQREVAAVDCDEFLQQLISKNIIEE